jgi:hypothetical protein
LRCPAWPNFSSDKEWPNQHGKLDDYQFVRENRETIIQTVGQGAEAMQLIAGKKLPVTAEQRQELREEAYEVLRLRQLEKVEKSAANEEKRRVKEEAKEEKRRVEAAAKEEKRRVKKEAKEGKWLRRNERNHGCQLCMSSRWSFATAGRSALRSFAHFFSSSHRTNPELPKPVGKKTR